MDPASDEIIALANQLLGSDANGWFRRTDRVLDGLTPAELACCLAGVRAVLFELNRYAPRASALPIDD